MLHKLHRIILALLVSLFFLFSIGGMILVNASESTALETKKSELDRIESEWEEYQSQIDQKYSLRIEGNKQRLQDLKVELERGLQEFDRNKQQMLENEKILQMLESRLGTLQGQLQVISHNLKNTEQKIIGIEEQIAIREDRLEKVIEEKERISAEADVQRDTVLDYFQLLQTESESLAPVDATGLKVVVSEDSFTKNLRSEMHLTALEKTARQMFHDLEGAMLQQEEVKILLDREREKLHTLRTRLDEERTQLALQKKAQKDLFETTLGEERRFQALLDESRQQMEQSSARVLLSKGDMARINAQLNSIQESKRTEQRQFSREVIESMILEREDYYNAGAEFLLQDQSEKPLSWPVPPVKVTAHYLDKDYEKVFGVPHRGIDLRAAQGTDFFAPAAGYVYEAKDNGMGYSYLKIIHKNNLVTVYGHVSEFSVAEGELVQKGDLLGKTGGAIGSKGAGTQTTGPHLHLEVMKDGEHVNPLEYLPLDIMRVEDIPDEYLKDVE